MPKIFFEDYNRVIEVEKGTSILEAAMEHHVPLYHTCGGNCSCSTCRVMIVEGSGHLSEMEPAEAQVLEAFDLKSPHRLGCQALVMGDVHVRIPHRDREPRPNKTPSLP